MLMENNKKSFAKTKLYMDTTVSLKVVTQRPLSEVNESMKIAFDMFRKVEEVCSRFNPHSEVLHLLQHVGNPVPVSDILFEVIHFAYEVAEMTNGLFDPTVGYTLESYGFNRDYLTRKTIKTNLPSHLTVSYKDIELDAGRRTVLLKKPLVIDLGAVAKGFAIDLAAKALSQYEGFLVNAGGDIFAGGLNEHDEWWNIGIQHPLEPDKTIYHIKVTDMAVCTSGNYERVSPYNSTIHHLINPLKGNAVSSVISSTVIAPFAMLADSFSTAAFVLGGKKGIEFIENNDLNGILITPGLQMHMTKGLKGVSLCK